MQDGASVPTQNVPAMHRKINFFLYNQCFDASSLILKTDVFDVYEVVIYQMSLKWIAYLMINTFTESMQTGILENDGSYIKHIS